MRSGTPSYFNAWTDTRRCLSGIYSIRQEWNYVNANKFINTKPPGTNPWGPCILRGIFLNQIRGRLGGEVTRSDGISTLGNGVAVSLASNHSGGQATRANRSVKLVQVEVMTANC